MVGSFRYTKFYYKQDKNIYGVHKVLKNDPEVSMFCLTISIGRYLVYLAIQELPTTNARLPPFPLIRALYMA